MVQQPFVSRWRCCCSGNHVLDGCLGFGRWCSWIRHGGSAHSVRSSAGFASVRLASSCPTTALSPLCGGCAMNGRLSRASGESADLSANENSESCRDTGATWRCMFCAPSERSATSSLHKCGHQSVWKCPRSQDCGLRAYITTTIAEPAVACESALGALWRSHLDRSERAQNVPRTRQRLVAVPSRLLPALLGHGGGPRDLEEGGRQGSNTISKMSDTERGCCVGPRSVLRASRRARQRRPHESGDRGSSRTHGPTGQGARVAGLSRFTGRPGVGCGWLVTQSTCPPLAPPGISLPWIEKLTSGPSLARVIARNKGVRWRNQGGQTC
jgi:hypothetical protein